MNKGRVFFIYLTYILLKSEKKIKKSKIKKMFRSFSCEGSYFRGKSLKIVEKKDWAVHIIEYKVTEYLKHQEMVYNPEIQHNVMLISHICCKICDLGCLRGSKPVKIEQKGGKKPKKSTFFL